MVEDFTMELFIPVLALTAALFVTMILLLASKPKFAGKITGSFIVTAAVGGLLIYGYGFSYTISNFPLAVIRALLAVCGMFVGKNDLSAISEAPLLENDWMILVFWVLHLLALYATASAAITTIGAEALKKLRLWLARRGQMNLIFGIQDHTVDLGKQLIGSKNSVVVFVDSKPNAGQIAAISAAGCAVRCDNDALSGNRKFLRAIGMGKGSRNLTVYAMKDDPAANVRYAQKVLNTLKDMDYPPEQTRLVIMGKEEAVISRLQIAADHYGYGYVSAVNKADLTARLLVRHYPPCNELTFGEDGRAREDFEALIVGFGHTGQAVLRQIVMNGQFEGSTFRASVFAPDCDRVDGPFADSFETLLNTYGISFHPYDARSRQMFAHLQARAGKIKYVAICTGSDKLNREIGQEFSEYFRRKHKKMTICLCDSDGIRTLDADGMVCDHHMLYTPQLLSLQKLDEMAMLLNHRYQNAPDQKPLQTWMVCDYFSRQSSRASADFIHAMVHSVGKTPEQAMKDWNLSPEQLLNLSKTEHLRWNAFHFCMGFKTMTEKEFDERAAVYRKEQESGKVSIRIAKNMAGRTHACLVSWEELVTLSHREAAVTGRFVDYQDMDKQNVLLVPKLLEAANEVRG